MNTWIKVFVVLLTASLFNTFGEDPPKDSDPTDEASDTKQVPVELKWRSKPAFQFHGGDSRDFLYVVRTNYGIDLLKFGTISDRARDTVSVPKINVRKDTLTLVGLLELYNSVSTNDMKSMGRWVLHPTDRSVDEEPSVILFEESSDKQLKFRVFHLQMRNRDIFNRQIQEAMDFYEAGGGRPKGYLHFPDESDSLFVIGNEAYIELVSELVRGYKEK